LNIFKFLKSLESWIAQKVHIFAEHSPWWKSLSTLLFWQNQYSNLNLFSLQKRNILDLRGLEIASNIWQICTKITKSWSQPKKNRGGTSLWTFEPSPNLMFIGRYLDTDYYYYIRCFTSASASMCDLSRVFLLHHHL